MSCHRPIIWSGESLSPIVPTTSWGGGCCHEKMGDCYIFQIITNLTKAVVSYESHVGNSSSLRVGPLLPLTDSLRHSCRYLVYYSDAYQASPYSIQLGIRYCRAKLDQVCMYTLVWLAACLVRSLVCWLVSWLVSWFIVCTVHCGLPWHSHCCCWCWLPSSSPESTQLF